MLTSLILLLTFDSQSNCEEPVLQFTAVKTVAAQCKKRYFRTGELGEMKLIPPSQKHDSVSSHLAVRF